MTTATFIFSIRKSGTLVKSWFQDETWDNIDALEQHVRNTYKEFTVECIEFEGGFMPTYDHYHDMSE